MRFVDDDEVKIRNRGHRVRFVIENPAHHALNRRDLDTRFALEVCVIAETLNVID